MAPTATSEKLYRVNEIFYSLQGEGMLTGTPAIFIRLSGCNRACAFCDTDHSASTPMTAREIAAEASRWPAKMVVITGGEPLLQLDTLLIDALRRAGKEFIAIETNGSLPVPEGVDWVACSPKAEPWGIDRVDELKIVYEGQDVEAIAARFPGVRNLFLQPCYDATSGEANTSLTVEYIKAHPHWRLSLQTHRLISIP